MPFGGWFDDYYSNIYCPAIESAGLVPKRADDLYRPSAIVHDIWNYTKNCRLVLADLTGKNPNVFYELGLAHAIAKPAILVTESIADVPFDLRALRVLEYDKNDSAWGGALRDKIATAIREVLDSPLQSVLPHSWRWRRRHARRSLSIKKNYLRFAKNWNSSEESCDEVAILITTTHHHRAMKPMSTSITI